MAKRNQAARRMTTIQDIAADLALSAMTVSRALNGHPDVKVETRARIEQRARELNYRPNRWARSLVTKKSHVIGVVIPDFSHTFFAEIIGGVQEAVEPEGYTLILCNSGGDSERERGELDMLIGSRADGLIVGSSFHHDDASLFHGLADEQVPFVLIDRLFDSLQAPFVGTDDEAVGRLSAEHLISLGHRRIAHINGPPLSTAEARHRGFRKTLVDAGLELPAQYLVQGEFTYESGAAGMKLLLALDQPPTAVFATNDPCALGAIRAVREAGRFVPGDVSVVGAGSIEFEYLPEPFLTTTAWSRRELGERAGKMLLAIIEGRDDAAEKVMLEPELTIRRSTAPAPESS